MQLTPADIPSNVHFLQAALEEAVCVGTTPRELSMMALSALTAWQACGSLQQAGLQPQHVAAAIRGWMAQHDSRVSGQLAVAGQLGQTHRLGARGWEL
jgi:hypothetical protein